MKFDYKIKCRALKKKFKDRMFEFQVYIFLYMIPSNLISILNQETFDEHLLLQTLKENIQQEYREVVERRVFTGDLILFFFSDIYQHFCNYTF